MIATGKARAAGGDAANPAFMALVEKPRSHPALLRAGMPWSLSAPKWCRCCAESLPAAACLLACPSSSRRIFLMRFGSARVRPGPRRLHSQAKSCCSRQDLLVRAGFAAPDGRS